MDLYLTRSDTSTDDKRNNAQIISTIRSETDGTSGIDEQLKELIRRNQAEKTEETSNTNTTTNNERNNAPKQQGLSQPSQSSAKQQDNSNIVSILSETRVDILKILMLLQNITKDVNSNKTKLNGVIKDISDQTSKINNLEKEIVRLSDSEVKNDKSVHSEKSDKNEYSDKHTKVNQKIKEEHKSSITDQSTDASHDKRTTPNVFNRRRPYMSRTSTCTESETNTATCSEGYTAVQNAKDYDNRLNNFAKETNQEIKHLKQTIAMMMTKKLAVNRR